MQVIKTLHQSCSMLVNTLNSESRDPSSYLCRPVPGGRDLISHPHQLNP